MKCENFFLTLLICLFFAGCASVPAGYHPITKKSDEGYSDVKVQDGIFNIQFKGNEDTSMQRVIDFALLRSAEASLENGCKYFTSLNEKADNKIISDSFPYTMPAGCYGPYCSWMYYTGWQTYTYQIPYVNLRIQCFAERPASASVTIFDAEQVKTNIRAHYGLQSNQTVVQVSNSVPSKQN